MKKKATEHAQHNRIYSLKSVGFVILLHMLHKTFLFDHMKLHCRCLVCKQSNI